MTYKYEFGRPREYNREKIANELVEWALLETSTNLNGFCSSILLPPKKLSEFAKECIHFKEAYEIAKSLLAERRERKLSNNELHVKAYDLNARVYDYFLDEKQKECEKNAKLDSSEKELTINVKHYN